MVILSIIAIFAVLVIVILAMLKNAKLSITQHDKKINNLFRWGLGRQSLFIFRTFFLTVYVSYSKLLEEVSTMNEYKVKNNTDTSIAEFAALSSSFLGVVSVLCEELTPYGKVKKFQQSGYRNIMYELCCHSKFVDIFYDRNLNKAVDKEEYEERFCNLIKKTEEYYQRQLSQNEINTIIDTFERVLFECISVYPELTQYLTLSKAYDIGEKVKSIVLILKNQDIQLTEINGAVKHIDSKIEKAENSLYRLSVEAILIIVATAIQLIGILITNESYPHYFLWVAPLSILVAELLTWFTYKNYKFKIWVKGLNLKIISNNILTLFMLPISIAVASAWIIFSATCSNTENIILYLLSMILGYCVGISIKLYINEKNTKLF